ncbi:hypothetical protein W97_08950 [Coniosporium apollinis CBS 100218]|uniref:Uncharacterized protein n=1 Tax=Coniosporium apollinis (strain CBS 100218) TaxID=1168221 RepID=R7Z682_CONA1|nr:uncharacterized protein W97_08950 [Coniosporium apollinis CBS 100218]EON69690.1 hypothetical protein W97_08950 [Coniosporium apollinis CBS 100218]
MTDTEPLTPRARRNSSPASPQAPTVTRIRATDKERIPLAATTRARRRAQQAADGIPNEVRAATQEDASLRGTQSTQPLGTKATQPLPVNANNTITTAAEIPYLISQLRDEILQQKQSIETLKQGQETAKKEREVLINQNKTLQQQVTELTELVRELTHTPGALAAARPPGSTPSRISWAAVAARGSTTQPQPQTYNTQSGNGPNTLRINTSLLPNTPTTAAGAFTRYMQTDKAVESISQALKSHSTTKECEVLGAGTTRLGYLIRFKNERSKELAKRNAEWTQELGQGTRVVKPRFGVVVHRTPTNEVNMEAKEEAVQKIAQENSLPSRGSQIEEITWLKKKDSPLGHSASLGIWFDTAEAAEQAVHLHQRLFQSPINYTFGTLLTESALRPWGSSPSATA